MLRPRPKGVGPHLHTRDKAADTHKTKAHTCALTHTHRQVLSWFVSPTRASPLSVCSVRPTGTHTHKHTHPPPHAHEGTSQSMRGHTERMKWVRHRMAVGTTRIWQCRVYRGALMPDGVRLAARATRPSCPVLLVWQRRSHATRGTNPESTLLHTLDMLCCTLARALVSRKLLV